MKLTKYEQETVILFNEEEDTASVYTFNAKMKEQLRKLAAKYPKHCRLERKTDYGAYTYEIKKDLVTIMSPCGERKRKLAQKQSEGRVRLPNGQWGSVSSSKTPEETG